MIKSIIDYVKYHYQFCENIESFGNYHTIHHKTSIFFQKDVMVFCLLLIYHIHLTLSGEMEK